MGKTITRGVIEELEKAYLEFDILSEELNTKLRPIKASSIDRKITVKRKDGTEEEISEFQAWEEINIQWTKSDCYEVIKAKYSDLFKLQEALFEKTKELDKKAMELGLKSATKISLREIIGLINSLVDLKISEYENTRNENK